MTRIVFPTLLLALSTVTAFGQEIGKEFYGAWNLNVAKSKIPDTQLRPRMGQAVVGPEGWVISWLGQDDQLHAYAVHLSGGNCIPIGLLPGISCEFKNNGRHITYSVKMGGNILETGEADLITETSFRVKGKSLANKELGIPESTSDQWYDKVVPPVEAKK